jgi:hypothetical protein
VPALFAAPGLGCVSLELRFNAGAARLGGGAATRLAAR